MELKIHWHQQLPYGGTDVAEGYGERGAEERTVIVGLAYNDERLKMEAKSSRVPSTSHPEIHASRNVAAFYNPSGKTRSSRTQDNVTR